MLATVAGGTYWPWRDNCSCGWGSWTRVCWGGREGRTAAPPEVRTSWLQHNTYLSLADWHHLNATRGNEVQWCKAFVVSFYIHVEPFIFSQWTEQERWATMHTHLDERTLIYLHSMSKRHVDRFQKIWTMRHTNTHVRMRERGHIQIHTRERAQTHATPPP